MSQLFLKGSFWCAWQSSLDRRMLTKSMKLILWSFLSLNNCYLFLCEGRQIYNNHKLRSFWYFLKWFFCTRRVLAAVRGSRFVWVNMCVRQPWVTSIASIHHIWPRYRRPKFWNNFSFYINISFSNSKTDLNKTLSEVVVPFNSNIIEKLYVWDLLYTLFYMYCYHRLSLH